MKSANALSSSWWIVFSPETSRLAETLVPNQSRASFAAAVDRVSTISSDKTRSVKMALDNGTVTLSASNQDASSASDEIEVSYDGAPIEIGFNARYLMEITSQIQGEVMQMSLADAGAPSLIQAPGDDANVFVLMPMRV